MRSAFRLVWNLDVRHLAAHRARLALSCLGIATGVALAVAVGSLNSSIEASVRAVATAAASTANIEVRPNGGAPLPLELIRKVQATEGVRNVGAAIESYVEVRRGDRHVRALALGIDSGMLRMSPASVDASAIRTADPFGLFVPADLADELGVRAGDRIELTTPHGWRSAEIGTVLPDAAGERSRVVVGTLLVMQRLFGREAGADVLYVEAADPDRAQAAVQRAVGDSARVGPVAFRGNQFRQLLAGADASLGIGTLVALFVGAFLVYNTMSMAAVERLQEAAVLRSVGARRRQVFALFCAEGGLLGAVGSALGVLFGVLLARQMLTSQGSALEEILPIQITKLELSPVVLAGACIAGIVASLAAAMLPARRLARAEPAAALGPVGALEDPTRAPRRATAVVGALCCVAGPAIAVPSVQSGVGASGATMAGFAVTLAGIALLIPTVVPILAAFAMRRLHRGRGVTRLAVGEVLRSPGRTAYTVGAVLLSLALVVGFSIAQASFTNAFDDEFESIISTDLYVRSATWRPFGSDVPLDASLASEIERVPGVRASWPFRLMPATFQDRSLLVIAYDVRRYAENNRTTGQTARDYRRQADVLARPDTVLASGSFLSQFGYEVGDTIEMPTPTGLHRLRIAERFNDPSAVTPEIVLDFAEFRRIWGSNGADTFGVRLHREADVPQVKAALARTIGERYGVDVDTRQEYFDRLSGAVRSITQLIGSVQLVAVVVAALGLANTLLISTLERRRDLGVLRAVGMMRRQLRRMVATEALLIGSLGVVLAWGLGTAIGFGMFAVLRAQLGIDMPFVLPPLAYAGAAVLGLLSAIVAALYPASRAARVDVVEALQYE